MKVAKIDDGTGSSEAETVFETLAEWYAVDNVTSANTERHIGACAILEHKLESDLLMLACRHHVYELMLKGAFAAKKIVSAPTTVSLENFKKAWDYMNHTNYTHIHQL